MRCLTDGSCINITIMMKECLWFYCDDSGRGWQEAALWGCREAEAVAGKVLSQVFWWETLKWTVLVGLSLGEHWNCACLLSLSAMSSSLQPHRLQPTRLLCSWGYPSKNSGVSWLPTPGDLHDPWLKPRLLSLLHWQVGSLLMCHLGEAERWKGAL